MNLNGKREKDKERQRETEWHEVMVICRSGVSPSLSHVLFSGALLRESEWVRLQSKECFGNTGEGKPVTQGNVKREGRREY